ncbi:MAG: 8-amino-7-oxononanoate synthase [Gammaproteobacteria bacterium]
MSDPFQLSRRLQERQQQHLYRRRRVLESPQTAQIQVDGQTLVNFCSNDYLGLANHPSVIAALQRAASDAGVGSGASHLVIGHHRFHHALEEALADFVQRPRALLFSTGFMANLGVISTLVERNDVVLEDRLNHASLLDGALLGRSQLQRYHHNDVAHLRQRLQDCAAKRVLVATDAVFSMDGDIAPLPAIASECTEHGAWLMVDDAHGFGVLGQDGRGSLDHFKLTVDQVPVYMATLGKALGTYGAFVAGSDDLIECLIQECRPYIYSTAMPPAVAAATQESLRLLQEESWRIPHLQQLIAQFRSGAQQRGLPVMESPTAIQPLLVGAADKALQLSSQLQQRGFLVSAIRPPTVPQGSSRLRITLSAAHSPEQIESLLNVLQELHSNQEEEPWR